jgi:hypothetical protein
MDNSRQQLNNLQEIRSLMERSSSFISLSGLSGISAGVMGLLMAFMLYIKVGAYLSYSNNVRATPDLRQEQIIYTLILSAIVLTVTFASTIFFTAGKAKKNGIPIWGIPAKNLLVNLFIPLASGGIFCFILLYHHYDFIVLPSMLIFYGLALLNAGKYTLSEIRWLGTSEIALGLAALLFLDHALYFWAAGFGLLNIIYGMVMYFRHER